MLGYLVWAEVVWRVLVQDDSFDWHAGLHVRQGLFLDLISGTPSWIHLRSCEDTKCVVWWQGWVSNGMLIMLDDCFCSATHRNVELNLVTQCDVVENHTGLVGDLDHLNWRSSGANEEDTIPVLLVLGLSQDERKDLGTLHATETGVLWHGVVLATFGPEGVGCIRVDSELSVACSKTEDSIIWQNHSNLWVLFLNDELAIFCGQNLLTIENVCQWPMEWFPWLGEVEPKLCEPSFKLLHRAVVSMITHRVVLPLSAGQLHPCLIITQQREVEVNMAGCFIVCTNWNHFGINRLILQSLITIHINWLKLVVNLILQS